MDLRAPDGRTKRLRLVGSLVSRRGGLGPVGREAELGRSAGQRLGVRTGTTALPSEEYGSRPSAGVGRPSGKAQAQSSRVLISPTIWAGVHKADHARVPRIPSTRKRRRKGAVTLSLARQSSCAREPDRAPSSPARFPNTYLSTTPCFESPGHGNRSTPEDPRCLKSKKLSVDAPLVMLCVRVYSSITGSIRRWMMSMAKVRASAKDPKMKIARDDTKTQSGMPPMGRFGVWYVVPPPASSSPGRLRDGAILPGPTANPGGFLQSRTSPFGKWSSSSQTPNPRAAAVAPIGRSEGTARGTWSQCRTA